jgi:hypothetical protein
MWVIDPEPQKCRTWETQGMVPVASSVSLGMPDKPVLMGTAASFAVPLFAALLLGWYGAGLPATNIGSGFAIVYWLAILLTTWLAFEIASWGAAYVLKPLNPSFLTVITVGCIFGGLTVRPFVVYMIGQFFALAQGGESPTGPPQFVWSVEWLTGFVQEALVILLMWIVANLALRGPFHLPRFGYAPVGRPGVAPPPVTALHPAPEPAFLERLEKLQLEQITALEAEDHYVRVHSDTSSELIHYRFTDAVNEMGGQTGVQVHRSFWVCRTAVESVVRRGRSFDIVLRGGKRVPVGQTYKQSAATEFKDFLAD